MKDTETQTHVLDTMPVKLGAKRVAFQLNTFLPQVNLTLVSVLQGVALGIMIAQFGTVSPLAFPAILLYVDSLMGIALIWHLYANAFISFLWPYSSKHTLLHFSLIGAESFALAYLSRPAMWALGFAGAALVGAVIRWSNTKVVSRLNYERNDVFELDMKSEREGARDLAIMTAIALVLGIALLFVESQPFLYVELTSISAVLLGIALLLALWRADRVDVFQKHFEGSPWAFEHYQLVERDNNQEQQR